MTDAPVETGKASLRRRLSLEWVAAGALGILAISAFALQAYQASAQTTPRETALYNALQFLLTVGFTWFSTRALSRSEFEQSLKRFAISAYRRVADIERMVQRLQWQVRNMIREPSTNSAADLRIVDAVVGDTAQVVRSSIADWADVIGEELLALERIKRLEQEKQELQSDSTAVAHTVDAGEALKRLDSQIRTLVASLPPRLQLEAEAPDVSRHSEDYAARWFQRVHEREDGVRLTVVTGEQYDTERAKETLAQGERLIAVRAADNGLDAQDLKGKTLGRIQNPSPLGYQEFAKAFELCFGPAPIALEFVEQLGSQVRDGQEYGWFKVRVTSTPILRESDDDE